MKLSMTHWSAVGNIAYINNHQNKVWESWNLYKQTSVLRFPVDVPEFDEMTFMGWQYGTRSKSCPRCDVKGFCFDVSLEWNGSLLGPIFLWCRHHYTFPSILLFRECFFSYLITLCSHPEQNLSYTVAPYKNIQGDIQYTHGIVPVIFTAFTGSVHTYRRERGVCYNAPLISNLESHEKVSAHVLN